MSDNNGWPDPARPGVPLNPERNVGKELIDHLLAIGWRCDWPASKPVPDDGWPVDIINRRFAAEVAAREADAFRRGAEAMREAAALWHDEQAARWRSSDPSWGAQKRHESHASRIRALPLPEAPHD